MFQSSAQQKHRWPCSQSIWALFGTTLLCIQGIDAQQQAGRTTDVLLRTTGQIEAAEKLHSESVLRRLQPLIQQGFDLSSANLGHGPQVRCDLSMPMSAIAYLM